MPNALSNPALARLRALASKVSAELEDDEYALVMIKNLGPSVIVSRNLEQKIRTGTGTPEEVLAALTMTMTLSMQLLQSTLASFKIENKAMLLDPNGEPV